jgi:hypothetical protein
MKKSYHSACLYECLSTNCDALADEAAGNATNTFPCLNQFVSFPTHKKPDADLLSDVCCNRSEIEPELIPSSCC